VAAPDASQRAASDGFRSDINGLRAISIALVVAYHLLGGLAPGGFIGVDVFFVISGFLMTNIIVGRLQQGRFRLRDFYLSRLRRIWPALVALCLALWLVGATLIDPWTFERIAADIPSVIAFASNIVFAGRQGYFAPDEHANWLLHTWSVSVEWQFYLLYPLLLLGLFAAPALKRRMWIVLGGLTAASFVLAIAISARGQGWSFYLLPTRAWELLAGALCAAAPLTLGAIQRGALHALGLGLIGIGALIAIPVAGWPSATALLPVGGAALVLVAGVRRTLWAENPVVAGLGQASYSIYIWHWPVIVALRYAAIPLDWPVALAAIAAMLALGLASYRLIEQVLTRWLFAPRPWRWAAALAGVAALAAVALVAAQTRGLEALRTANASPAVHAAMADLRAASEDWVYPGVCGHLERQGRLTLCQIGDPSARRVLVVGDSHAEQIAPRYAHAFDGKTGQGITFVTAGGCMPVPGVGLRHRGGGCAAWADAAFRLAETAAFRRVVIVSAWTVYFDPAPGSPDGISCLASATRCEPDPPTMASLADAEFVRLAAAVGRLRREGIDVVLMQPTPQGQGADPQGLYRRLLRTHGLALPPLARVDFEREAAPERVRLARVAAATGAPLVEPLDALCPGGACPVEANGRALYKDRWHFRASAMTRSRFAYLDPWLAPAAAPMRLK
jgi:peptidoglycan/LPS O-acetylase OafA/YrhL